MYGTLAWFTDEITEKHPEPYLVVASSAWAVHFGLAAVRLKVYGDYGLAVGLASLAIVIGIHLASLSIVKLSLMFGWGFLVAAVNRFIMWATNMRRQIDEAEREHDMELGRLVHHEAGDMRTDVRTTIHEDSSQTNSDLSTHVAPNDHERSSALPTHANIQQLLDLFMGLIFICVYLRIILGMLDRIVRI